MLRPLLSMSALTGSLLGIVFVAVPVAAAELEWAGQGAFRAVVTVQAAKPTAPGRGREAKQRPDERPASVAIDFAAELRKIGVQRRPDIASLQVIRHDPNTGKPLAYTRYAYPRGPFDRPFRWYDEAIPYEFPEFANAVSRTKGKIVRKPRTRGGHFFNAIGDWQRGRLAWMHTDRDARPATYAVYFDLLEADVEPRGIPPRGWLGDGTPRCDHHSATTMGADHCRIDLDDWNGDGLIDLVVGEHYGHVFWWPNLGTPQQPVYRFCRFVVEQNGRPLDAGIGAAPKVVDWDGDGNRDLLVGTHWNRLLYYRNVGTNSKRRFAFQGVVELKEKPLELPIAPLARGDSKVFRRDYYPVPETVDWDHDGDQDLLLGGYVTGRVFLYENVGANESGTPQLIARGPLEADEQPLNVGHWCAAPCVADFDGDGDLDLVSGNMPMYVQPDEEDQFKDTFLQLFEQTDKPSTTARSGRLRRTPFPRTGSFPRERLGTPRAFDWDSDGDLDLVVSARMNIYLFRNQGTRQTPRFAVHAEPLRVPWGLAPLAVDQFRDWNGDGCPDLINGYTVRLNDRVGNPYRWTKTEAVLPPGVTIAHWSRIGDDWFWPYLDDFDRDGRVDVLFGDWHGHVWFHRNESRPGTKRFDVAGFRFKLASGAAIKVGPINKDPKRDFDALQGARTVFTTGDFNRDGLRDLVVGDTYGKIRYFEGRRTDAGQPYAFADAVDIADLGIRGLVDATDWNRDGWPDVIASAANGRVQLVLNRGGAAAKRRFLPSAPVNLPPIIQPRVRMVDLNGDGDEDLFLPSTQGSCFVERSFLTGGYAAGTLVKLQRRNR